MNDERDDELFHAVQVTAIDKDTERVLCLATGMVGIVRRYPNEGRGVVRHIRFEDPSPEFRSKP